jgi:hypothetical protein
VSAPRPPSPPVRKLLATHAEEDSSQEYGICTLTLTLWVSRFLLFDLYERNVSTFWPIAMLAGVLIFGVIYGKFWFYHVRSLSEYGIQSIECVCSLQRFSEYTYMRQPCLGSNGLNRYYLGIFAFTFIVKSVSFKSHSKALELA